MDEQGREWERAGLAWALADLAGLLDRGVIDAQAYEVLRRDYEARLRWLGATSEAARPDERSGQGTLPPGGAESPTAASGLDGGPPARHDAAPSLVRTALEDEGATPGEPGGLPGTPGAGAPLSPAAHT